MRKLYALILIVLAAGAYLHYVRGWDWERLQRTQAAEWLFLNQDASATTTPIGLRGVGTHWETAVPMPDARADFGAAVVGNTIYVVGGVDGYFRTLNSVLAYDIGADAWRRVADLPQPLHHAAVATDGQRLYALGGMTGLAARPVDSAYAYDPQTNAWRELGDLNDFRGAAAAAFLDGRLYVMGGSTTAGTDDVIEYYNFERGSWNGVSTMPTSRGDLAAVAEGDAIYALGGRKGSVSSALGTTEAFDPAKGTWRRLPDMAAPRSGLGAAAVGGRIYALGGVSKDGVAPGIEIFDVKTQAWSAAAMSMDKPRHGLAAVAWKNRIYAIGGGLRPGFSVSDLNQVLILADDAKK